ncbi:MAG: 1-acyl-sn-glycerol-3-phosphate acyltransferase [Proteobacteria bacterium]|nr:1-acyl-sn-glycerol-3-phosphate acyltransferase [Pseudomonadota bacterium]
MRFAFVLAAMAAITFPLMPVQWLAIRFNLAARRRIPIIYHRMICAILGIRITRVGACVREHPLLIVANHSSWLDIAVISAVTPAVFVAKSEIAGWPLFGRLAKLQRSVFVDRSRRHGTAAVNAEIARRLAEGDPVVLFGEGTAGDGNRVLAFRSALIGAARDALAEAENVGRVWIQPLSLAYTGLLGVPVGRRHRPLVAWYGKMRLWTHFAGVGRRGAIDVTVTWGEPIAFGENADRKAVALALECSVRQMTVGALRGPGAAGGARPS